jgi:hypothetical protein
MKRTTLLVRVGVSVLALLALVVGKGGGMIVIPNRVRVVVVMVSALALAAGLLTLALLEKPAQAQAQTFTDTDRIPVSGTASGGDCNDEPVFFEGTLHTVAHTTIDENGGFHTKFQSNLKLQGEGLSSGDKYILNDTFNFHRNSSTGADLNFTFTATGTSKIIRQGSDTTTEESNSRFVLHVTVNANGELTTDFLKFEETCVGT